MHLGTQLQSIVCLTFMFTAQQQMSPLTDERKKSLEAAQLDHPKKQPVRDLPLQHV